MRTITMVVVLLASVLVGLLLSEGSSAGAEEIEIFAGQDKTGVVDVPFSFNDGKLVKPDPPDPLATYHFSWDFDGSVDEDQDGTKTNDAQSVSRYTTWTYETSGVYLVTLTVTDGTSTAIDTLEVTVRANHPPVITVEPYQVAPYGKPFELQVNATDDLDRLDEMTWEWDLGDGSHSWEPIPLTHTYDALGDHNVTVWVLDTGGKEATVTFVVTVVDMTKPVCDAGEDVSVLVNTTVHFDGTGSHDNLAVVEWTWNFDHGDKLVILTGARPNHTFFIAGSYVVGLKVEDAAGNVATDSMTVTVRSSGSGNGGAGDPNFPGPARENQVWRSLLIVVVVVSAFAVAIAVNSLKSRNRESLKDQSVFFGRRSPR